MKEWYTAAELMGLPGLPGSERRIRDRAQKDAWTSRQRQGKGGGLEYHLCSFPDAARNELVRRELPELAAPAPETALVVSKPVMDLAVIAARKAEGDARAAQIRGKAQARMDAKREILALIEDARRYQGLNTMTAVVDYNAGRLDASPEARARLPKISLPSVHRWFTQINGYGLARLAGDYRRHRAGTGIIDTYPQLGAALRAFIIEYPHGKPARAYEWLKARYDLDWDALPKEIAGDGPIPMPSTKTVERWIQRWKHDNAELYIRLSNPDQWKSRFMIGWGDASAHVQRPNQVWEYDSTPADVMLEDGRHSILGVIDLYTRRAHLHISKTSRSAAVAHLTKIALQDWGVPEIAKTDNGQDYVSHHINRIFYALGIEHQVSAPFCPWQKPHIERFFRTFSHDLVELLPGYIGHCVADREALRAREQFSDRLFVKNRTVALPGLTAPALQAFCDRWIPAYHQRPHSGLNGQTPAARIAAWGEPLKRIQDERVLNLLLQEVPGGDGWRTVTKAYGVRVDNHEYIGVDLVDYVDQKIRVLYDPEDAGLIYCLDDKDRFIGRAECPELTGTPRQALAAQCKTAQQQALREETRAARREAKAFLARDAAETILAAREAALVVFPPPSAPAEPYATSALDGAAQALLPAPAPVVVEVSAERMAALRQDMAAREAARTPSSPFEKASSFSPPFEKGGPGGILERPDFDSAYARVHWTMGLILQKGQPYIAIRAEDRAYVRQLFAEKTSLEKSMRVLFQNCPRYEEVRAWFLQDPDAIESSPTLEQTA